jgi:CXXX repeat modification system protein
MHEHCHSTDCKKEEKIILNRISYAETTEIRHLFERRNSLTELLLIVSPEDTDLLFQITDDLNKTKTDYQNWWNLKSKEYEWVQEANQHLEINFDTGDVLLVKNNV